MSQLIRVQGYHGTSIEVVEVILREGFRVSRNEYDWLGDGVYFFLNALGRAWDWARDLHGSHAAVIGSTIHLEDCMNLLEPQWSSVLAEAYDSFIEQLKRTKSPLPVQTSGAHRLDRAVINYTVGILAEQGIKIRVVQGAFREGRPHMHQGKEFAQVKTIANSKLSIAKFKLTCRLPRRYGSMS